MSLSGDKKVEMYRSLLLLRKLEEKTVEMTMAGQVPGWLHSYLGQEAVAVGVAAHLRLDDFVASTHRGRGHFLAKGLDPNRLLAEVLGRQDGVCGGKGGEMHMADWNVGVIGSSGIVGGILSTATGVAFACQYQDTDRVVACFFGDAASNQGSFHESLNLASVWRLPILFVCENNGYGEFTRQQDAMRVLDIATRAQAYDIPGVVVDGDDVLTVAGAAAEAVGRARSGEGPTLLECKTHRWSGHYTGDPQDYRTKEELEDCRRADPIPRFRDHLIESGLLMEEAVQKVEAGVDGEVAAAVEFALNSPLPLPEAALADVYGGAIGRRSK
jgi:pyruvate dehydrogenase E1 component alpha subunit